MKFIANALIIAALTFAAPALLSFSSARAQSPEGAWTFSSGDTTTMLLITPGYFSCAVYNEAGKSFIQTFGGAWKANDDQVTLNIEFHTKGKEQLGPQQVAIASLTPTKLVTVSALGGRQEWARVDEGKGVLSGDWRISAREQNGKMNPMRPGARKTVKILSGTRFQWVAMNTDTGEFFGTGGGSYTFKDGVYTENIDFFSRDGSRVGAALSFQGKVTGNDWDHRGHSSKGDPIHELWTRQ